MIAFYFEDIARKSIGKRKDLRLWLEHIAKSYRYSIGDLNYIFCSDAYLLEHNQRFLNHNDYTDVITFNYNVGKTINGDIFISYDRVKENAKTFSVPLLEELKRVMAHGVLHLCGLNDKTSKEQEQMRDAENRALDLLNVPRET